MMEDITPIPGTAPVTVGIAAVGPCVLWTGYRTPKGYGIRYVDGRYVKAHRQAWADAYGHPGALNVCHHCDVRACINIDHLFLGTNADNVADKVAKGRQSRLTGLKGQQHGRAKVTDDQVREIRASTETGTAIGHRLGVPRSIVSDIRLHQTWTHIP